MTNETHAHPHHPSHKSHSTHVGSGKGDPPSVPEQDAGQPPAKDPDGCEDMGSPTSYSRGGDPPPVPQTEVGQPPYSRDPDCCEDGSAPLHLGEGLADSAEYLLPPGK